MKKIQLRTWRAFPLWTCPGCRSIYMDVTSSTGDTGILWENKGKEKSSFLKSLMHVDFKISNF